MIKEITKRRAIRKYLSDQIDDKKLADILMSAMFAPSANASYPWDLVVVKDAQTRDQLSKVTPWASHLKDAPIVIAVVGYEKESPYWVEDCSIVATHIWLSAVENGLSSCWTQIRGNDNAEKEVKRLLKVPDDNRVLCLMPIGSPANELPGHTKEEFEKGKVKMENY